MHCIRKRRTTDPADTIDPDDDNEQTYNGDTQHQFFYSQLHTDNSF